MAKKKKELSEQEKKKNKEEKFNRQINFYVMRSMWQVIRKRGSPTIYDVLNTSRERYTRVINTGVIRFKKAEGDELRKWERTTGVDKDIFTGKEMFHCFYMKYDKREEITREQWDKFFSLRGDRNTDKKELKNAEEKICTQLENAAKHMELSKTADRNFYALCFYLKNNAPAPLASADDEVKELLKHLKRIDFNLLDNCSDNSLQKMREAIVQCYRLAEGICRYRELRAQK